MGSPHRLLSQMMRAGPAGGPDQSAGLFYWAYPTVGGVVDSGTWPATADDTFEILNNGRVYGQEFSDITTIDGRADVFRTAGSGVGNCWVCPKSLVHADSLLSTYWMRANETSTLTQYLFAIRNSYRSILNPSPTSPTIEFLVRVEDVGWRYARSGRWQNFLPDTWFHLAHYVLNPTDGGDGIQTVWIDGVDLETLGYGYSPRQDVPSEVGNIINEDIHLVSLDATSTNNLNGQIDDLRIYDASQIDPQYGVGLQGAEALIQDIINNPMQTAP